MSETTTTPPAESDAGLDPQAPAYKPSHVLSSDPPEPEPKPTEPAEAPPAETEPEKPPETAKPDKTPEEKARERDNRRYAQAQAARYAEKARADQLEARLRELQTNGQPQTGVVPEAELPQRYAAMRAQERAQEQVTSFHEAGTAAFPDWQARCQSLMEMGADSELSQLLVELPDGAKVAGALSDDPEALERIAGLKTERSRAIALGRYSAALEGRPAPAAPAVPVSRAPAPIQPPTVGRARGEPDPNGSFEDYRRWSEKVNWNRR